MKKALYLSVAAVSLFAMIFAGCDGGSQVISNDYEPISAPKNLKATAQPGINVITWDVVKDAKDGYEVTRKDTVTGEVKTFAPTTPYYADKVGFTNPLVNERKYTYTVVAKSGSDLRNGEATTDVTAVIPGRDAADVVAAPVDIAFKPIVYGGQDKLEVTWTGDANLNYSVYYVYSDGTVPLVYNLYPIEGTSLKRQTIPFMGGDTTVKITVKWDEQEYYKSAEGSKTFTGTGSRLPGAYDFKVTPAATGIYTLTWTAIDGADAYDIWRAELISGSIEFTEWKEGVKFDGYEAAWPGATLGEWKSIDTASKKKDGNVYTLTDSVDDTSKRYIYGIVAKNTESEAKSGLATKITDAIVQNIATTFSTSNIVQTKDAAGNPYLTINVDAQNGETLILERAEAVYATADATEPESIGAYTAVSGGTNAGTSYTWVDTPAIRASYRYKLTASKGGLSSEKTAPVNTGAYTPFVNYISASAAPVNVYSIQISLDATDAYPEETFSADIYRVEVDKLTNGKPVGVWTASPINGATKVSFDTLSGDGYIDAGDVTWLGKFYTYHVVLTSTKGTTIKTLTTQDKTGYVSAPSASYSYNYKYTTNNADTVKAVYVEGTQSGDNPYLKLLDGADAIVVLSTDTSTILTSSTISRVTASTGALDNNVPQYAYVAQFTKSALENLNTTSTPKTYSVVIPTNVNGSAGTREIMTFTVTNKVIGNAPSGW
ncbi:MAG: hypothetical protein LBK73_15410 [Treponema sp.]|jgi:hypothetical protein|nr:hypothetical protein [Treponema sp.]